jgi:D-lactate dehydrogenase
LRILGGLAARFNSATSWARAASRFRACERCTRLLALLHAGGVRLIALRSAGFNHVDLQAAASLELPVVRVPEYSPYAVAEHAVALMLALNRKIHRAFSRVREGNFSLDGLVGFDLHSKTVGLVGTGRIGTVLARIMTGFGCRVLAADLQRNQQLVDDLRLQYVDLEELCRKSDIVSLHVPLTPATRHLIDATVVRSMKRGVMLINTGRGALVDTRALIEALKQELSARRAWMSTKRKRVSFSETSRTRCCRMTCSHDS